MKIQMLLIYYLSSNGSVTVYIGFNLTNYVKTTFTLIPASSVGPIIINNHVIVLYV